MKTNLKYVVIVGSIVLVALLGGLFVNLGLDWFNSLKTPNEFVPAILITIVWVVIYSAFAVILCLWAKNATLPLSTGILLIINGALNVVWCLLFFTLNSTLWGLVAIILNLILAVILIINLYKKVPLFAYILSIYPLWVSIATCLNLSLWILN